MKMTERTLLLDQVSYPFNSMSKAEYEAIIEGYEVAAENNYLIVQTPTIKNVFIEFQVALSKKIAQVLAYEAMESNEHFGLEDVIEEIGMAMDDNFSKFNQISYEWMMEKGILFADYCYIDSEIGCTKNACLLDSGSPCTVDFSIVNSPQFNLLPTDENGIDISYLLDPTANPWKRNYKRNYTSHLMSKRCTSCLIEEDYPCLDIEIELIPIYEKIVGGKLR